MFDIIISDEPSYSDKEPILTAKIIINQYSEAFNIPITYWNINKYKENWKISIAEGLQQKKHAALVTSMYEPSNLNFIFVWILYFDNDYVHIQNSVIFLDQYPNFNINRINEFIPQREIYNEDGIKISEWKVKKNDVIDFYGKL